MLWLHTAGSDGQAGLSQEQLLPPLGHSTLQSSPRAAGPSAQGMHTLLGHRGTVLGRGRTASRAALGGFVLYAGVMVILPAPARVLRGRGVTEGQQGAPTASSTPFLAGTLGSQAHPDSDRSELSNHIWELLPLGKQILCSRVLSYIQGSPRAQEEPEGGGVTWAEQQESCRQHTQTLQHRAHTHTHTELCSSFKEYIRSKYLHLLQMLNRQHGTESSPWVGKDSTGQPLTSPAPCRWQLDGSPFPSQDNPQQAPPLPKSFPFP